MGRIIPSTSDELPSTADVVVIGGGIAGAVDAYFLGRAGLSAIALERGTQLAGLTTAQAVACFRAQWDEADYAALVLPSIDFYERFGEETGLGAWEIGLRERGWLFLTAAPDGPDAFGRFVAATRSLGVEDSELLVGGEIRRRFPWVGEAATAATFRAHDGWVSPYEVVYGLARASAADFHLGVDALEILVAHGRVEGVRTNRGTIATPRVVVAAGPFSRRIAATAGVDLPVTLLRRHRAMISPQPEIPADGPMTLDVDTHAYWRPEGGGAFLGMGLPEDESEPADPVPTDWTFPAVVMEAAGRLVPFWAAIADRLTAADVNVSAGQYTVTADGRPILGGCHVDGLFLHAGDNGWGIEGGPEAGRRLAAIVAGELPDDASNPYRLDRPGVAAGAPRLVTY